MSQTGLLGVTWAWVMVSPVVMIIVLIVPTTQGAPVM